MAETDLERAFRALEGAHTAGKTEDARKIAGYIRDLQESEEEPESLGALPFVNLAIAKTIGGPVDITAAGLGLIPGMKRAIGPPNRATIAENNLVSRSNPLLNSGYSAPML